MFMEGRDFDAVSVRIPPVADRLARPLHMLSLSLFE
jgi:hypothetical protein